MTHPEQSNSQRYSAITVLWAISERYSVPHVVRAWSHSLEEAGYGLVDEINEAVEWMEHWGDERGWRYWTTVEHVPEPQPPEDPEDFVADRRIRLEGCRS